MINVYQLQIFLTVVDKKSFSAAAEQLSLSQPAVSQQIKALEEAYKVKLFARYGQRIELTELGYNLVGPARRLLSEAMQLDEQFNAGAGELSGRITILYSRAATEALYVLPEIFARFNEKHPGVQFFLQSASEEEAINGLLEREVTFAALGYVPRQKSLENFLLKSDKLELALPPGHSWTDKQVSLTELKGQRVVMRGAGSETRRVVEQALSRVNLSMNDLQVVAEVDSSEALALLVEAGLGLGLLSGNIIGHFKGLGRAELDLSEKEVEAGTDLDRNLYLIRIAPSPDRSPSPSQQRFWEDLRLNI